MASDERELVDGLHQDDPGALAALFDRYGDRIYNHCFRATGDWAEAEDHVEVVRRRRHEQRDSVAFAESHAHWGKSRELDRRSGQVRV